MGRLTAPLLMVLLLTLGTTALHAATTQWIIMKQYGVRYPVPRRWLKGDFNPTSTIKWIALHPDGARILFATEMLPTGTTDKTWAAWSKKYLIKRKFKQITTAQVLIMGKPDGVVFRGIRKGLNISMVHLVHRGRGLLFTYSCDDTKLKKHKVSCKTHEKEFHNLIARIILF